MISKTADEEFAQEADEIIEALLGETIAGPATVNSAPPAVSSSDETYQLPVRVGQSGQSLEDGDKPWIVGHFSPGVQTDANHPTGHNGVDLRAPYGTPIFPIASGVVVDVGTGNKSGNYVKVSHENGKVTSFYGHMLRTSVQRGQQVTQRTSLGEVGSTGNAKGRGGMQTVNGTKVQSGHCHVEVKIDGTLVGLLSVVGKRVGALSRKASVLSNIEKLAEEFVQLSQE